VLSGGTSATVGIGGPLPSPSPTRPPPVSPERYQQALTATDDVLAPLAATFAPATQDAANDLASTTARTMREQADLLQALTPPAAVSLPHLLLLGGLINLSRELDAVHVAKPGRICAGSAVPPMLAESAPAAQIRSAAQSLATADPVHPYTFGKFLPGLPVPPDRRLGNGTVLKRGDKRGSGKLEIENNGAGDIIVSLTPVGAAAHTVVYVTGGGKYTVSNIRDGKYDIFVAAGSDWDAASRTFARDCAFEKFDEPLDYSTTSRQYTVWTITLGAGLGGNSSSSDVTPDAFPWG
jgi:hypothetical protein